MTEPALPVVSLAHQPPSPWRRLVMAALTAAVLAGCGGADTPATRISGTASAPIAEKAGTGSTGDVYRFAKISNGAYFYTGNAGERDIILASFPDFRYEGVAFQQSLSFGSTPVYRFANLGNGGYFYTASAEERDFVRATRPDMRFEGTTFSVATPVSPGAIPVFRLANLVNGAYLYTGDAAERDFAVGLGIWRSEGTAFFVPPPNGYLNCPDDALASSGTCVCRISGYLYDAGSNTCALPPVTEVPVQIASGWSGDYIDGGGGTGGDGGGSGGGSGGGGDGGGAGGGSSLGILKKAKVEVWYPKNGVLFLAATGETDSVKGMVTIRRGTYDGPALVIFKGKAGATYFDEALGTEVPFPEGSELNVMLPSLALNFGATPLTEAAFQYAMQIYGDPRVSREVNLVRILTPLRIQVANDLIRSQINAVLPPNTQLTDIARLPYIVGPATPAGALPNTPNGLYGLVLASFPIAARNYLQAMIAGGVPGASQSPNPASEFMRQLAQDLTDGRIDTFAGNAPVAPTGQRTYTLSVVELAALRLSNELTLPATLATALQTATSRYAGSALSQTIGKITIPPPPPPPPTPITAPSCQGTTYPLPGGGTGCCLPPKTVQSFSTGGTILFFCL